MIVEVIPPGELREGMDVLLKIKGVSETPLVYISSLGDLPVLATKYGYEASLWGLKMGDYQVKITSGSQVENIKLEIKEQQFLTFNQEFGIFSLVLFLSFVGVFKWMKKNKKKQKLGTSI